MRVGIAAAIALLPGCQLFLDVDTTGGAFALGDVEVLADAQAGPRGIAIDDDRVYWANEADGSIAVLTKKDRSLRRVDAKAVHPHNVVLDASAAYWGSNTDGGCAPGTGIMQMLKAGTSEPQQVRFCTDALTGVNTIALDSSNVYWSTNKSYRAIFFVSKQGGDVQSIAQGFDGNPNDIAVTPDAVYWTNTDLRTITRYDKASGSTDVIVEKRGDLGPMVATPDYLYFTTGSTVARVGGRGGEVQVLASGQNEPTGIALYRDFVYWSSAGGDIARVAAGGGTTQVLARDQTGANSIAVDASGVYFARGGGRVSRLPAR